MAAQKYIYFLEDDSPYSNFYKAIFTDTKGNIYESSEKYFMMQKAQFFSDLDTYTLMQKQTDPSIVKDLGGQVKNFDSKRWKEVSYKFMLDGIRLKVNQNEHIKKLLLETGDAIIAEASPTDLLWGIGLSEADAIVAGNVWKGQNLLGKCLMELRDELRK